MAAARGLQPEHEAARNATRMSRLWDLNNSDSDGGESMDGARASDPRAPVTRARQ